MAVALTGLSIVSCSRFEYLVASSASLVFGTTMKRFWALYGLMVVVILGLSAWAFLDPSEWP